jgi:transcriptional regulator with XRE-family HTH domain
MTQEQVAAKAGISRPYLARLETARQDPTLSTLEKLAKALRVKVGRLLE